jgi:hypothetical protein
MLLVAPAFGAGDFPPEHLLGKLENGVSPDVLIIKQGRPGTVDMAYQPVLELYPLVKMPADWKVRAEYVQKRMVSYFDWRALAYSPVAPRREFSLRRVAGGLIVLQGLASQDFKRIDRLLIEPHLRGYEGSMVTPAEWTLEVDGRRGPSFEMISWLTVSRDGKRLAYAGRKADLWRVVLDGKPGSGYSRVDKPVFSPDGKRFAYCAMTGMLWHVVSDDGSEGPGFSEVGWPVFSPDGKSLAYTVVDGTRHHVVLNGKKGEDYDMVERPVLGPGGKMAYPARNTGEMFVVLGERELPAHQQVSWPTFSIDGKHFAYAVCDGSESQMVLDGVPGRKFDQVDWPVFADCGDSLAYRAREGMKWIMVVDDHVDRRFDLVDRPIFGPRGKLVAFAAQKNQKWFAVSGDSVSDPFDWVGRLRLSPDGKLLGFGAQSGSQTWWKVIRVGKKMP